jgi:hypothetical protein
VKNGSLTGADLATGPLGRVANAANADHATTADNSAHAANADNSAHAANADNSAHAANADNATDSAKLDGHAPNAFLPSSRVVAGSGATDATSPQTVVHLPLLNVDVTTDGDADADYSARFVNHEASDVLIVDADNMGGAISPFGPGASTTLASGATERTYTIADESNPGPVAVVNCAFDGAPNRMNCIATEAPGP